MTTQTGMNEAVQDALSIRPKREKREKKITLGMLVSSIIVVIIASIFAWYFVIEPTFLS